jgi:hypothetical protein
MLTGRRVSIERASQPVRPRRYDASASGVGTEGDHCQLPRPEDEADMCSGTVSMCPRAVTPFHRPFIPGASSLHQLQPHFRGAGLEPRAGGLAEPGLGEGPRCLLD